jgi:hypothetical protein
VTSAEALSAVLNRAEGNGWAGPDPYDGLGSDLGRFVIPLGSFPRFALSQALLRSSVARRVANPDGAVNSKGLALFLGAASCGRRAIGDARARALLDKLSTELARRSVAAGCGRGWGYPFPWQSRYFWAPAGTANTVVTATVGWHLLDAGEAFESRGATDLGLAAARFLNGGLNFTQVAGNTAISYTSRDRTLVVNLSALAARLFVRAAKVGRLDALTERAVSLARFVLSEQREDGSWPYSADRGGGWEDSFHTGYVLEALLDVREAGLSVPDDTLARGFAAYARFFDADGGARLYAPPESVLDAHSAAQGVITYAALHSSSARSIPAWRDARGIALRIASWAREALWVQSKGYFAYRIQGGRRDEREFTRWVQAWMALAMATAENLERATIPDVATDAVGVA